MGQVLYSPITQAVIESYGWSFSLALSALTVCAILPLAFLLPSDPRVREENVVHLSSFGAIKEAFGHRGFLLLTAGFFVCGFHVKGKVNELDKMLPEYYDLRGWSEEGVPTDDTLGRLGLG